MEIDAPYESPPMRVLPEWIDYNGHMNLGFYLVAFELAQTHFYDEVLDLSRAYGERTGHAAFALETHINYLGELHEGDPLRVLCRVLEFDDKRVRSFNEMYHAERNILAATNEQMFLHVKVSDGKSVPFFPETRARLEQVYAAHRHLSWPGQAGRAIGMPRRKAS